MTTKKTPKLAPWQDAKGLTYEQELQRQERVMAEHPERFPS